MDRRTFLKSAAAAGAGAIAANAQTQNNNASKIKRGKAKPGAPNVVFILSDQHNAKCMGHLDYPVSTPNFDRMAAEGVRFDACTTANPICTPSRVSFLSGQYCHNHGYYGLSGPNPGGLPSLFEHFRAAGYRTAAIGKIHCPENWVEDASEVFHDTCGTSVGGRSEKYRQYLETKDLTKLEDAIALHEFGAKGIQAIDARASKTSFRDSQEGWTVSEGLAFMEDCNNKNEPFFVHLSFPRPHQCYTPAQEFWDLYDESKLELPPNVEYDMSQKAPHFKGSSEYWKKGEWALFEPKTFEAARLRKLHGYLGCISHVDHAVGEVLDWLKANDLDEDTIVVYSSDHGDYACEHNIMEKAPGICADAITRVPMLWRWGSKLKSGHAVKDVVETVDVAPTLCALAGLEIMETADGLNLESALKGSIGDSKRSGLTEFGWSKSLRKDKWRLVTYPKEMFANEWPNGFGELYNVEDDPWEMNNLYFDKQYANIVTKMKETLMDKLITTTRPTTVHGSEITNNKSKQRTMKYHHQVNADNKMHYERMQKAAKTPGWRRYQ